MWTAKTVLTLSLCFLEDLLLGGAIYGWPSLAYVYRDQGLFGCDDNQTGVEVNYSSIVCPDQDKFLPLGMTVGLVALGLATLGSGWMFDRYGLRVTRTVTIVIGVSGSLCLAFADRKDAYLIFPGAFLTGTACSSIIATNHHVALLADKRAPVFNLLNSGGINSAVVVYFMIKLAYEYGFSQRWSLLILTSLWIIVALTTYLLLPKFKIQTSKTVGDGESDGTTNKERTKNGQNLPSPLNRLGNENHGAAWTADELADTNYEMFELYIKSDTLNEVVANNHIVNYTQNGQTKPKVSETQANADTMVATKPINFRDGIFDEESAGTRSLWHYMFSFGYVAHVVYFNLVHVWIGLLYGIMNTWLMTIYNGDTAQVSYYTNIYIYVIFICGFLHSPFAGILTDCVRRFIEGRSHGELTKKARAMVTAPGMMVTSIASILVTIFMLIEQTWSVYPAFIFMDMASRFCYGNVVGYIVLMFPVEHFGVLHGVLFAVTGATLAVQFGYVSWVEAAGFAPMVGFQLAVLVLSLVHPGIITIRYMREKQSNVIFSTRL